MSDETPAEPNDRCPRCHDYGTVDAVNPPWDRTKVPIYSVPCPLCSGEASDD